MHIKILITHQIACRLNKSYRCFQWISDAVSESVMQSDRLLIEITENHRVGLVFLHDLHLFENRITPLHPCTKHFDIRGVRHLPWASILFLHLSRCSRVIISDHEGYCESLPPVPSWCAVLEGKRDRASNQERIPYRRRHQQHPSKMSAHWRKSWHFVPRPRSAPLPFLQLLSCC